MMHYEGVPVSSYYVIAEFASVRIIFGATLSGPDSARDAMGRCAVSEWLMTSIFSQGLLFTNTMRPVFVLCKLVCLALILHQIRAACPTAQDLQELRDRIDGTLILPGEQGYGDAGTMKAPNYNSGFNFVLYAKSIGKLLHLSVL